MTALDDFYGILVASGEITEEEWDAALAEHDAALVAERDRLEQQIHDDGGFIDRMVNLEAERDAAREQLAAAEAVIEEAKAIPHGEFGPWDDDLCDYPALITILSGYKPDPEESSTALENAWFPGLNAALDRLTLRAAPVEEPPC